MKPLSSYAEMDALGRNLSDEYNRQTGKKNVKCFDIVGFITDYLNLSIVYETFGEEYASKYGFLSDGFTPLVVFRDGKQTSVIFPENTIVIDNFLRRKEEMARWRYTLAHEAAHYILKKHTPLQTRAAFSTEFDKEANNTIAELRSQMNFNEVFANRLGAALLINDEKLCAAVAKYTGGKTLPCYEGEFFTEKDKLFFNKLKNNLGVSYSALINRIRDLGLIEWKPFSEYSQNVLGFGVEVNGTI